MTHLFLDYETRAPVDLKNVGLANYAPRVEPILAAWYLTDDIANPCRIDEVQQWDRFDPSFSLDPLIDALRDPSITKSAFNAPFEMAITEAAWGIPCSPREWVCTMSWAYSRGFTGSLEQVGKQLGLDSRLIKNPNGSQLIKRFSKPRPRPYLPPKDWTPYFGPDSKDDEGRWQEFCHYNKQDVVAEHAIARKLLPHPWSQEEHDLWVWDREVNKRGLPIDIGLAEQVIQLIKDYEDEYGDRVKEITGLPNPNSRDQVLQWINNNGVGLNDLQRETIEAVLKAGRTLDGPLPSPVQEVLQLRQSLSQAAVKKYAALLQRQTDGRLTDTLQPWGAGRTGRWAGRGFQLQNLKRPMKGLDYDFLADLIKEGWFDLYFG